MTGFDVACSRHSSPVVFAAIWALLVASCGPRPSAENSNPPPDVAQTGARPATGAVTAVNLEGERVPLFAMPKSGATVLLFLATECPISNRYAPEIRRLEEKFSPLGIRFWRVYPEADVSPDAIRSHLQAHGYPPEALQDPKRELAWLSGVRVTPEAAVFLPGGQLVYHGRIDDRYVAFGKERPAPRQHDLEATLDAILHGRPVPSSHAPAVGCTIPDPR